ncbi:MAG: NADH-quinone oxidoreductase subunit N [Aggregatilineales bacterium]
MPQGLNLSAAAPALTLAIGACFLFLIDVLLPAKRKDVTPWLAVILVAVSAILTVLTYNANTPAFSGMFRADTFTGYVNVITLIATFLGILVAYNYLKRTNMAHGEYYPLLLLTCAGIMFMGAAGDLVIVFVALELLSIPLYILSGLRRPDPRSEESAMKYFLLGAFSTGFLVYGIALTYGATGTTNLATIFERLNAGGIASPVLLLTGTGLILVGLGFKVAAVPFHLWTPDVYQGAPTPVTAFMSVGAKVGGFAALLRVLTIAVPTFVIGATKVDPGTTVIVHAAWQDTVSIIAALTMILGNFVAITQKDIKRLLAYSSIAHAGYILMSVAAAGSFQIVADAAGKQTVSFVIAGQAVQGALIYLIAYAFTNIGAFAVAIAIERNDMSGTLIDDFAGLNVRRPLLAAAMAVFMLSLTGIPLTAGFIGKYFVFNAAINANLVWLALVGVLTSIVSAFYYLRVIVKMYLEPGEADAQLAFPLSSAIALCAAGTVILGILPTAVNLAQNVVVPALIR